MPASSWVARGDRTLTDWVTSNHADHYTMATVPAPWVEHGLTGSKPALLPLEEAGSLFPDNGSNVDRLGQNEPCCQLHYRG